MKDHVEESLRRHMAALETRLAALESEALPIATTDPEATCDHQTPLRFCSACWATRRLNGESL